MAKNPKKARAKPPDFLGQARKILLGADPLNVAAAFSLGHLLFLRIWIDHIIPLENAYFDYTRRNATWENLAGLWLAALFLLAPLTYLFTLATSKTQTLGKKIASPLVVVLFLAQVALVVNVMFQSSNDPLHAKNPFFGTLSADALWILLTQGFALLLWLLLKQPERLVASVRVLLVLLAPFPFLVSSEILGDALSVSPRLASAPEILPTSSKRLERTVVMVFDELDYHLVFGDAEKLAQYPHFAELKRQSLSAENALPPAQNTLLTLPSYWFGRNVTDLSVRPREAPQFRFFHDASTRGLASPTSLFLQTAQLGAKTEIVGWSHPYCELFGRQVNRCVQSSYMEASNGEGVRGSFFSALTRGFEVLTLMGMTEPAMLRKAHLDAYRRFLSASLNAVTDPENDFVFLHLPVPHEPVIYSRAERNFFEKGPLNSGGYEDNVTLADETFGQLRQAMRDKGVWDKTNVLVVADHAFRNLAAGEARGDQMKRFRIPFLLKPALAKFTAETYRPTFSTRVVGPLALELLKGKLRTPASVVSWLDSERRDDLGFLNAAYANGKKMCAAYAVYLHHAGVFDAHRIQFHLPRPGPPFKPLKANS